MLRIASPGLAGRVVQADLRDLPVGSGVLDGVWSVASLLHVPDEDTGRVLHEWKRIMKPQRIARPGQRPRCGHVPRTGQYARGESRWFVYRDRTALEGQLRLAGFTS